MRRIIAAAVLVLAILSSAGAGEGDETMRFLRACGTPDRDVAVFNSFAAPERTLYYDRAGFAIVFHLPKQPQGPLPRLDGHWFWPTVKPPYQWQYDWVRSLRDDGCVPANYFLKPCCHISVQEKYLPRCPQGGSSPPPCSDGTPPYGGAKLP